MRPARALGSRAGEGVSLDEYIFRVGPNYTVGSTGSAPPCIRVRLISVDAGRIRMRADVRFVRRNALLATLVLVCRPTESCGYSRVVCLHRIDIETFGALVM